MTDTSIGKYTARKWRALTSDPKITGYDRVVKHLRNKRTVINPPQPNEDHFLTERHARAIGTLAATLQTWNDGLQRNIFIHGDFDVDGFTSVVQWALFFQRFFDQEHIKVTYRIPDRSKGYGLDKEYLLKWYKRLNPSHYNIVITVDTGVGYGEWASKQMPHATYICIDHHPIPHTAPYHLIHPLFTKGEYHRNMSGGGLTYMTILSLARMLYSHFASQKPTTFPLGFPQDNTVFHDFATLAAMSTVCDVCPLQGANRAIVRLGTRAFDKTKHPMLSRLRKTLNCKRAKASDFAFSVGPLINAVGRLSQIEDILYGFIAPEDGPVVDEALKEMRGKLKERKSIQQEYINKSIADLDGKIKERETDRISSVLYFGDWVSGLNATLAAKLSERYGVPAFVGNRTKSQMYGWTVNGSARFCIDPWTEEKNSKSSDMHHLHLGTILNGYPHMIKAGGHRYAAGFTIPFDKEKDFIAYIQHTCHYLHSLLPSFWCPDHYYDFALDLEYLNSGLAAKIEEAGPYGKGFPHPVFLVKGTIEKITEKKGHGKLKICDLETEIWSFFHPIPDTYKEGDEVEMLIEVGESTFNMVDGVSLKLVDMRGAAALAAAPSQKQHLTLV